MPYVNWQCDIADCRQNAVSLFSRCDGGQETWAQFKPWRRGEEISRDVWGLLPRRVRRRDARGRQRCRVDAEQFISIFSRCRAGQSPAPTATLTEMYDPVGTKTRIDCMSSHFRGRDFCPPREGGGLSGVVTLHRSFIRRIYVRGSSWGECPHVFAIRQCGFWWHSPRVTVQS